MSPARRCSPSSVPTVSRNQSAAADAKLQFLSNASIRLDITIAGVPSRPWGVRIYSQGTCNAVLNWVANRDQSGQFITVLSNTGERQILLFAADVARIRAALEAGQSLSLMVAGTSLVTGLSYRTCTSFRAAPFPPLTTTTATSTATSASTTSVATPTPPVTIPVTTSVVTTTAPSTTYSTGTTVTQLLTITTSVTVSTTTGTSVFFTTASESVVIVTTAFTSTTTVFSTLTTGTTFTTVTTVTL